MTKVKAKLKTIAQLIEEIRGAMDNTAEKYVPQVAQAIKAEHPELSRREQQSMLERICGEFWEYNTVRRFTPVELKDPKYVQLGKAGKASQVLKRKIAQDSARIKSQMETQERDEDSYKSPISLEQERKHDDSVDDQYHYLRSLIELLSGIDYVKERDSNLVLVDKTKEHRFKLVKQLSDLDVKAIYTDGRTLAHILNDYLKLLDNELEVRQAKEKLVSE